MAATTMLLLFLSLGLISVAQCQQDSSVFTAYAPGHTPSYRATPRLVGVKVNEYRDLASSSPYYFEQLPSEGRNVRITTSPPLSYAYVQPGEAYPQLQQTKRIRVAAAPQGHYADATLAQPVQYRRNVPAVATYKQAPVAYAQQHQPQVLPQFQYVNRAHAQPQPQPQAYRQVAAAPQAYRQAAPVQAQRPVLRVQKPQSQKSEEELEPEYPSDPNPQYNFAFDVKDDEFTNYQNRQESKQAGITKGSYSVVDPDGYVRTVTYTASPKGGFQAKVTRELTDVKIKFPVPTPAPEEEPKVGRARPVYATQPHYITNAQYAAQPQYASEPAAAYAPRRLPQVPHRLAPQYNQ